MKKFRSRKTNEIIIGTFKESTKTHKGMGWDWSFVFEDGKKRWLFESIEEFCNDYIELPNPLVSRVRQDLNSFLKGFKK